MNEQSVAGDGNRIELAMRNLVKFNSMKPFWPRDAASPEFALPFYRYCDGVNSSMQLEVPPAATSDEIRLVTGVCQPGQGMALHDHSGDELMFAASGSWVIYFDRAEEHKVFLEPWDAILVPGNLPRGWRNVGAETGCLLNIGCTSDRMTMAK